MIGEKTTEMIDMIRAMSEKDKLRLAICLADSNISSISYDKKEMLKIADSRLREIDEEYRTRYVDMTKYGTVLITTSMITELPLEEQNKVTMFFTIKVAIDKRKHEFYNYDEGSDSFE